MKEKINFHLIKTLLKKQFIERTYGYKRKNFDVVGFILRLAIIAMLMTVFIIFFGRFMDIYISVKDGGAVNVPLRLGELLSIVYTIVIIFMTISAISRINHEIFNADDIKTFAAMPIGAKSLFISKLIVIYLNQLVFSAVAVLTVNITVAIHSAVSPLFFVFTVPACFVLPLITIAIGSVLALPFNLLSRFLQSKFVINFILVTAIAGGLFYLYSIILGGVKEMLLGDSLRYFFNEARMSAIAGAVSYMYPAKWFANMFTGTEYLVSGLGIVAVLAVCLVLSVVIINYILRGALQSRVAGTQRFIRRSKPLSNCKSGFFALVKKEFLLIFRTPSYMFSYFSVAVIMPLMVYFCMSISSSLVTTLVGLECNPELALFLTLLFGALTNVFCATNISRDGQMFYTVKAMPFGYKTVFFSKVFLCMLVTVVSQLATAVLLASTGYLVWYSALFIFIVGTLFGFVHVCVATRYDFNHARFSTEDDGEIKESDNVVSALIVLGLLVSVLVGGAVFVIRLIMLLFNSDFGYATYLIAGGAAVVSSVLAYLYLIGKLGKKYYEFEGGEL